MSSSTYIVTFYREIGDQAEDVKIRDVKISLPVSADDLAAGDWDAYELVVGRARVQSQLDDDWDSSHVTLPDGEVAEVPAGL